MVECSRRTLVVFLFAFLAALGTITSADAAPVPNGNSETSGDTQKVTSQVPVPSGYGGLDQHGDAYHRNSNGDTGTQKLDHIPSSSSIASSNSESTKPAYMRAMSFQVKYQNKQDEIAAHKKALDIADELQKLLKLLPKGSENQVKPEIINIFDKETTAERIEVVTNGPMYQYANEAQRSLFKGKNTPSLSDELDIELWEVLTRIAEASPPREQRDYISWAVQRLSTLQSF
ncbi:hypothetical protein EV360DRAFT_75194 [Lentinula raphanica]|nr:hypothetical protein EV360DRAFT_75194 [Lentinula raphanica]